MEVGRRRGPLKGGTVRTGPRSRRETADLGSELITVARVNTVIRMGSEGGGAVSFYALCRSHEATPRRRVPSNHCDAWVAQSSNILTVYVLNGLVGIEESTCAR